MPAEQGCGLCGFYPQWLRDKATSKMFTIVYGLLGTIQSMSFIYVSVTLTTLEKRFKIPSRTTGKLQHMDSFYSSSTSPSAQFKFPKFKFYSRWPLRVLRNDDNVAHVFYLHWEIKAPNKLLEYLGCQFDKSIFQRIYAS